MSKLSSRLLVQAQRSLRVDDCDWIEIDNDLSFQMLTFTVSPQRPLHLHLHTVVAVFGSENSITKNATF